MKLVVEGLSHVTFETPDIDQMVDYYVNVVGLTLAEREGDDAHLYTLGGRPALSLRRGTTPRVSGISFVADPEGDVDECVTMLKEKYALSPQMRSDVTPSAGEMMTFKDLNGIEVDIISDIKRAEPDRTPRDFLVSRLGHVAFMTPKIDESVSLYGDLGFRVADWRGDFFAWMRCGPEHHAVDFVRYDRVKLHHYAYEVKDTAELLRVCDSLGKKNVNIIYGPGRHVIADNVFTYHRAPDGQIVEIFTEMAKFDIEQFGEYSPRPWHRDNPYKPRVWPADTPGNLWGRGAPDDFAEGSIG